VWEPTTDEEQKDIERFKDEHLRARLYNPRQRWMRDKLLSEWSEASWKQQFVFSGRIFDFWNSRDGVAILVDYNRQDPEYDAYSDEFYFRKYVVLILRVEYEDDDSADQAMAFADLAHRHLWKERKRAAGLLVGPTKRKGVVRERMQIPRAESLRKNYLDWLVENYCS